MRAFLLAACLVCAALPAGAGFDDGAEAYMRGDYGRALAVWLPMARAGDAAAQLRVGEMLRDRQGVRWRDFEGSAAMFRLAAAQGVADAQYELGRLHYEGFLVPRDTAEMTGALFAAARQDHGRALLTLGVIYEYGLDDVRENLTEALKWYELARQQGAAEVGAKIAHLRARVRAKMTEAQIAAALELAEAWTAQ